MNSFTNLIISQKIGIQIYKQLIVAIIKHFMLENLNQETLTLEEEENQREDFKMIRASQMNHSVSTEEFSYDRNNTIFLNIRGNLQIKYLQFCLRYFSYFKIEDLELDFNLLVSNLRIKEKVERENIISSANSLALRFSKSIAPSSFSKKHSREKSSISTSLTEEKILKRVKIKDLLNVSTFTSSSIVLNDLLKEFLNNLNAIYKIREQELLVKAILLKIPYIFGILLTSSRKSLSYLLTASLNTSNITIVIVPLLGLKHDIIKRAKEFNIPVSSFKEEKEAKTLTFVSIETIIQPKFLFLLRSLVEDKKLDKIILDKCYLLITSSSYRSIMFRFKEILRIPT